MAGIVGRIYRGVSVLTLLTACSGAQLVLKGPVSQKCADAGLEGCPEITDGVLLYVNGDKAEATTKLKQGAAANSPENVRAFTEKLRIVMSLPGVDSYSGPIREVIDLLAQNAAPTPRPPHSDVDKEIANLALDSPAARPATRVSPSTPPPDPPRPSPTGPTLDQMWTVTVYPGRDQLSSTCDEALAGGPRRACQRLLVLSGPFVVTNIIVAGGCADEQFVLAEAPGIPSWNLAIPANGTINVAGGGLAVTKSQTLSAGVRAPSPALKGDAHCAITVGGWRPSVMFDGRL